MKKLIKTQLKKIDKTINRMNKLFADIDNFVAKNSLPKTSALAERKTKFFLARKKNWAKIKNKN